MIKLHSIFTDVGLQCPCGHFYSLWYILFSISFLLLVLSRQILTDSSIICPNSSVKLFLTFLSPFPSGAAECPQSCCVSLLDACVYNCNCSLIVCLCYEICWESLRNFFHVWLGIPVLNWSHIKCLYPFWVDEWMNEWIGDESGHRPQARRRILFYGSLYLHLEYKLFWVLESMKTKSNISCLKRGFLHKLLLRVVIIVFNTPVTCSQSHCFCSWQA